MQIIFLLREDKHFSRRQILRSGKKLAIYEIRFVGLWKNFSQQVPSFVFTTFLYTFIHLHHLFRHDMRRIFRFDELTPVASHCLKLILRQTKEPTKRLHQRLCANLYPCTSLRTVKVAPWRSHGSDDRCARGQRFSDCQTKVFRVGRQHKEVGRLEQPPFLIPIHAPDELHDVLQSTVTDHPFHSLHIVGLALACHKNLISLKLIAKHVSRLYKEVDTLLHMHAREKQNLSRFLPRPLHLNALRVNAQSHHLDVRVISQLQQIIAFALCRSLNTVSPLHRRLLIQPQRRHFPRPVVPLYDPRFQHAMWRQHHLIFSLLGNTLHVSTCRQPTAVHMHNIRSNLIKQEGNRRIPRIRKWLIIINIMHRAVLHHQRILRSMRDDMYLCNLAKTLGKHLHISRSTARRAVDTWNVVNDFHFLFKDLLSSPCTYIVHFRKILSKQQSYKYSTNSEYPRRNEIRGQISQLVFAQHDNNQFTNNIKRRLMEEIDEESELTSRGKPLML